MPAEPGLIALPGRNLSAQLADEACGLVDRAVVRERPEGASEVGVECCALAGAYRGGEKRCRPDPAGQFRQAPPVLDGKVPASGQLEASLANARCHEAILDLSQLA